MWLQNGLMNVVCVLLPQKCGCLLPAPLLPLKSPAKFTYQHDFFFMFTCCTLLVLSLLLLLPLLPCSFCLTWSCSPAPPLQNEDVSRTNQAPISGRKIYSYCVCHTHICFLTRRQWFRLFRLFRWDHLTNICFSYILQQFHLRILATNSPWARGVLFTPEFP